MTDPRTAVIELSRALGSPEAGFVILTEGNASALGDDGVLYVTASGSALETLRLDEVVEVRTAPVLDLVRTATDPVPEVMTREVLDAAVVVDPRSPITRPSIETVLHAVAYDRTAARFVGHTHPTAVVGLACSAAAPAVFGRPVFPDEAVICGPAYAVVPYMPPGPLLAGAFGRAIDRYRERHGVAPRAVVLQNHGLVALGETASEVLAVTAMAVKGAEVRLAALAAGGLRELDAQSVDRLVRRDDEAERRARLVIGRTSEED